MASTARSKSKKKTAAKKSGGLRSATRILVEDLRPGDKIVTGWHSDTLAQSRGKQGKGMSVDEVMDVLREGESNRRLVSSSFEVKLFEECPSKWRTHVHVNKQHCYDMRTHVWIVAEKEQVA